METSPFNPPSPFGQPISDLFIVTLAIGAVVFVLVTALVLYASFRYRYRSDKPRDVRIFESNKLEITWTVLPLLLLAGLMIPTVRVMRQVHPTLGAEQPDVVVTAHQFWWEIHYPKSGVVTANEIHIPVGRPLLFELRTDDVIHDFWVPALGRKMDMIPDQPHHVWYQVDEPGVYKGVCAEYCGAQHAWMLLRVDAQPPDEFEAWQQQQLQVPAVPTTGAAATGAAATGDAATGDVAAGDAARGARLFRERTCINCHVIEGVGGRAVGPNLTHVASRQTLGAGIMENTPENLAIWIVRPQDVKPGNLMPNFKLTEDEVRDLVAYLLTLK